MGSLLGKAAADAVVLISGFIENRRYLEIAALKDDLTVFPTCNWGSKRGPHGFVSRRVRHCFAHLWDEFIKLQLSRAEVFEAAAGLFDDLYAALVPCQRSELCTDRRPQPLARLIRT